MPPQISDLLPDPINIDTRGNAPTPAPPIDGAKSGGTLFWLESTAPAHLDPQQINASDEQAIGTVLFRRLTDYIEDPKGGRLTLVGDLATNTGESPDFGKTWTYHLRDGIRFSDGTPITSKDIAYGIARSFGPYGEHGPQLVQDALDPSGRYSGPDVGDPPGIATPDDRTIRFTLSTPHPEWPFLMALPTSIPVPRTRDSGARYEVEWVASGPYMLDGAYDRATTLILKKNPSWDPTSDPVRHQYLDRIVFDFRGGSREDQTIRLIADEGDDQYAVATAAVAPSQIERVQGDPTLMARTGHGPTATSDYIAINTSRVPDLTVRQALNWSFDRKAYAAAAGGDPFVLPATWILAPIMPGWQDYNFFSRLTATAMP